MVKNLLKILSEKGRVIINIPPYLHLSQEQIAKILETLDKADEYTRKHMLVVKKVERDLEYFTELYKQTFPEKPIVPSSLEQQVEEIRQADKIKSRENPQYWIKRLTILVDYLKDKKALIGFGSANVEPGATPNNVAHDIVLMSESPAWDITESIYLGGLDSDKQHDAMNKAIKTWEEVEAIIKGPRKKQLPPKLERLSKMLKGESNESIYFRERTDFLYTEGIMSEVRYRFTRELPFKNLINSLKTFDAQTEKKVPDYWQKILGWYSNNKSKIKYITETESQTPENWKYLTAEEKSKISLEIIEKSLVREI
jgi:hypothetical protein